MVIPREPRKRRGLRRDYTPTPEISKAYLLGVLHDATVKRTTYRIATKSQPFTQVLKNGIKKLGSGAWIYKEGKERNLWIVEFPKSLLNSFKIKFNSDKIDYIRGYFDAEGGVAKSRKVRFYLSFSQKNKKDLSGVKKFLEENKIASGIIHNPSKRVDPNYWRFFIRAKSYLRFIKLVGSFHPEKSNLLWMKI